MVNTILRTYEVSENICTLFQNTATINSYVIYFKSIFIVCTTLEHTIPFMQISGWIPFSKLITGKRYFFNFSHDY